MFTLLHSDLVLPIDFSETANIKEKNGYSQIYYLSLLVVIFHLEEYTKKANVANVWPIPANWITFRKN